MTDTSPSTLLLRLAGPLQSWGTSSRWTERDTGYEPSKSGVVGILAAALGYGREADLTRLAALKMGVRVDQEGVPGYDFQSAGAGDDDPGIAMARDSAGIIANRRRILATGNKLLDSQRGKSSISRRYFVQDAIFLVGLESDDSAFLAELDAALRAPVYPIGLGRRSYVPSVPIAMVPSDELPTGIRPLPLRDALIQEPWPVAPVTDRAYRTAQGKPRRFVFEDATAPTIRNDQPIGAAFTTRVFGPRAVDFQSHRTPTEEPRHV